MRLPALLVTALAACGSADDAAPDAGRGPLDGTYQLTWTCMPAGTCFFSPPLLEATSLAIDGRTLTFDGAAVSPVVHVASTESEQCLAVPGQSEGPLRRSAYQLCLAELTATAAIEWVRTAGGAPATWRLDARQ